MYYGLGIMHNSYFIILLYIDTLQEDYTSSYIFSGYMLH